MLSRKSELSCGVDAHSIHGHILGALHLDLLNLAHDVHARGHAPESFVAPIEEAGVVRQLDEETAVALARTPTDAAVHHRHQPRHVMLDDIRVVREGWTVDGAMAFYRPSLYCRPGEKLVEGRTRVAEALLARAQSAEVLQAKRGRVG